MRTSSPAGAFRDLFGRARWVVASTKPELARRDPPNLSRAGRCLTEGYSSGLDDYLRELLVLDSD